MVIRLSLLSLLLWMAAVASAFVLPPAPSAANIKLAFVTQQHYQKRLLVSSLSSETEADATASSSATEDEDAAAPAPAPELSTEAETSTEGDEGSSSSSEGEAAPKRVVARDRHTIFAGNLPFDVTEEAVRELCSQYGKVELVSMPKNRNTGQPRGFSFVDMSTEEEMDAAIEGLNGQQFEGRILRVSKSVPKEQQEKRQDDGLGKIYVGNLPFTATRDEVMEFYKEYVDVVEMYLPSNPDTGDARGFAFLTVKEEDVERTIEATDGIDFEGRPLTVNKPLPPGKKAPRRERPQSDRTKIYVGNLSFYTVPDTLYQVFEEFGAVHDIYFPEDVETGGSRGFAFITMDKEPAMNAIAEIDGCELDGRTIRVNEAQPKGRKAPPPSDDHSDSDFGSTDDE